MTARRRVLWALRALVVAGFAGQAAFPFVSQPSRERLAVYTTFLLFSAVVGHAAAFRGPRAALMLAGVCTAIGLAVEVAGTRFGIPFTMYSYGELGVRLFGVPIAVSMAWPMIAYPAWVIGQRTSGGRLGAVIVGAWAQTAWDLFLDPLMVREGYWTYAGQAPAWQGVPLINFAGWFAVSMVMMIALQWARWRPLPAWREDRLPVAMYAWVWLSYVFANLVLWDQAAIAAVGGLGMGAPLIALWMASARRRPAR